MFWFSLMHLCTFLLEWLRIGRLSEREKDLEILLLRQQVTILERKVNGPLRVARVERLTLAVVTKTFQIITRRTVAQLGTLVRIFQPATVLGWPSSR